MTKKGEGAPTPPCTVNGQPLESLSVAALDQLIQRAIHLRACTEPPVPAELPVGSFPVIWGPSFAVAIRDNTDAATLLLRHPGAGWFGVDFNQAEARALQRTLSHCMADLGYLAPAAEGPARPGGHPRILH